jgi:hypothetical protein
MNAVLKGSVALAVTVALVSILIAVTGLHTNPMVSGLVSILVFVLCTVAAVVWVLKQTAAENSYGRQLLNGLLLGVVSGVLIFVFSWLLLTVVFPNYLDESKDATIALLENAGMPEAQLDAQIAKVEAATPISNAFSGTIGTIITSLIVSAIVAIFIRKK